MGVCIYVCVMYVCVCVRARVLVRVYACLLYYRYVHSLKHNVYILSEYCN